MCNFTRLMINFRHLATTTKITKIQQNHQIGVDHIIWSFSVTCHHVGLYRRLTSKTKITRKKTAPSFGPFFQQIGMHSVSESNKTFNVQNSSSWLQKSLLCGNILDLMQASTDGLRPPPSTCKYF